MAKEALNLKLVIIGDGGVGKTAILTRFVKNEFVVSYQPTIFENYVKEFEFGEKSVRLSLWDTAGQEGYESLRTVSYNADVYLLCYATDSPMSLKNVAGVWAKELNQYDPKKPKILVGTKADLKADAATIVATAEAEALCKEVKATTLVECSSKTGENVRKVFEEAVMAVFGKHKDKNCSIV